MSRWLPRCPTDRIQAILFLCPLGQASHRCLATPRHALELTPRYGTLPGAAHPERTHGTCYGLAGPDSSRSRSSTTKGNCHDESGGGILRPASGPSRRRRGPPGERRSEGLQSYPGGPQEAPASRLVSANVPTEDAGTARAAAARCTWSAHVPAVPSTDAILPWRAARLRSHHPGADHSDPLDGTPEDHADVLGLWARRVHLQLPGRPVLALVAGSVKHAA